MGLRALIDEEAQSATSGRGNGIEELFSRLTVGDGCDGREEDRRYKRHVLRKAWDFPSRFLLPGTSDNRHSVSLCDRAVLFRGHTENLVS